MSDLGTILREHFIVGLICLGTGAAAGWSFGKAQLELLTVDRDTFKANLERASAGLEMANKEKETLQQKLAAVQANESTLISSVSSLKQELDGTRATEERLSADVSASKQSVDRLTKENASLKQRLAASRPEPRKAPELTEDAQRVFAYLFRNGQSSVGKMCDDLKISDGTARYSLKLLWEQGLLRKSKDELFWAVSDAGLDHAHRVGLR